jgi:hypothetical protein
MQTVTLHAVDEMATVIKLDIEGTEFDILPAEIDKLENVHSWIIEVHPRYGDGMRLAAEFMDRKYHVSILDKSMNLVRPIQIDETINTSTTIFCLRSQGA